MWSALLVIDEMQDMNAAELTAVNKAVHEAGQGANPLPVVVGRSRAALAAQRARRGDVLCRAAVLVRADRPAHRRCRRAGAGRSGAGARGRVGTRCARRGARLRARLPVLRADGGKVRVGLRDREPVQRRRTSRWASPRRARRSTLASTWLRWNRVTHAGARVLAGHRRRRATNESPRRRLRADWGGRRGDLSVRRDQLIKKGVIYAPERGYVAFTVPGMAEYIGRQP